MLLIVQPTGHLFLRMALQPTEQRLVEALLNGSPGDGIALHYRMPEKLDAVPRIARLSAAIGVDLAQAVLCQFRDAQGVQGSI